jgi:hypothetical protein
MQFICRSAHIKTSFNSWYTTLSVAARSLCLKRILLQTMRACKRLSFTSPKERKQRIWEITGKDGGEVCHETEYCFVVSKWQEEKEGSISSYWNKKEKNHLRLSTGIQFSAKRNHVRMACCNSYNKRRITWTTDICVYNGYLGLHMHWLRSMRRYVLVSQHISVNHSFWAYKLSIYLIVRYTTSIEH